MRLVKNGHAGNILVRCERPTRHFGVVRILQWCLGEATGPAKAEKPPLSPSPTASGLGDGRQAVWHVFKLQAQGRRKISCVCFEHEVLLLSCSPFDCCWVVPESRLLTMPGFARHVLLGDSSFTC